LRPASLIGLDVVALLLVPGEGPSVFVAERLGLSLPSVDRDQSRLQVRMADALVVVELLRQRLLEALAGMNSALSETARP
jgi:hypothetical protein